MRYFAVMSDGRVIKAEDVCEKRYTDNIYFTLDGVRVKYCRHPDCYEDVITPGTSICKRKHFPFYKLMNDEWWVCEYIDYIISLDETEDEELNYFQSTDFNTGIIYHKMEKALAPLLKEKSSTSVMGDVEIPIIQMLPAGKSCGSVEEEKTINATSKAVIEHFDAVYGKNFSLALYSAKREKQYIKISYCISRKEEYKEMTVAEIEEELGYNIKVVGDK